MVSTRCRTRLGLPVCAVVFYATLLVPGTTSAQASQPPGQDAAAAAHTQEPGLPSLEQLLQMEVESVFGASKFLQRVTEAPASVTIVSADEIRRYGWRTLADVLRATRGFYVTDDRAWGYVGVRGFQRPGDYNTRILLLLDGRRVNDTLYDQAVIQEDLPVDLGDVERIEIIRGPSSSLYGSNAFFGVINLISRAASPARTPSVAFDTGSMGLRTGRASVSHRTGSGVSLHASATLQRMHGVDSLYYPEFDEPVSNFGVATGLDYSRRQNVFARVDVGGLHVTAGLNDRRRGIPTGAYETVFNHRDTWVDDERGFANVTWEGDLPSAWRGEFRLAYDTYRYEGNYPYEMGEDGESFVSINSDNAVGRWLTGEARASRTIAGHHRLTLGVEHRNNLRQDQVNAYVGGPTLLDDRRSSNTTGLFAQDEWRAHAKVLVSLGVRMDSYDAFDSPVKPRAALILLPDERSSVKLLFGQAFRAPNVYETSYAAPGYKPNPDVKPEEIRTVEVVGERYVGKRMRVSGSIFSYSVDHLIDFAFDPSDGLSSYKNLGAATATGVEAEAEAKWPEGIHARLSYTFTRTRNVETGDRLTNSPAHNVQALFSTRLVKGAVVGVDVRALSARTTPLGGRVASHVVPNVTLSVPVVADRLALALTVSNVTDTRYADPVATDFRQESITQNGRATWLGVRWTF